MPISSNGTSASMKIFSGNFSAIQNASNPDATLKKKHVAISLHDVVHEAITAGVISPFWLKGEFNLSNIMTKQRIADQPFLGHVVSILWVPEFHIWTKNNLS
jgi:hypothetical protein